MPIVTHAEYEAGDLLVSYVAPHDRPTAWGLRIIPLALRDRLVSPREWLDSPAVERLPAPWRQIRAWDVDPLVHAHLRGETLPGGCANGRTLRNSATTAQLVVLDHVCEQLPDGRTVFRTTLQHPGGLRCIHEVFAGDNGVLELRTTAQNTGSSPIILDALSAFSLSGITPFAADDASERLWVHRCRSAWSAEGRHEARSVESLHLERSWSGHGVRSERFGQAGSLPVNGWFPLVGIEDREAAVTWAAQLATPGSWQLEIYRRADQLALGGGGADRLFGEWSRTLAPGESFSAPPAYLTAVAGNFDAVCDRLVRASRDRAGAPVADEAKLPIVFNEWCTSWGHPTQDSIVSLADRLAGTGVRYLVIDDGWAERPGDRFQQNGDWRVNRRTFPGGLRATTDAVRARGLVPGLWFEFEAVNPGSAAWNETSHQLHRDGVPLQVGSRRYWDFRDPWVHDFLAERVLARLRDDGFGYLKIDYNDSIGPGVDGPESPGENLRQHLDGVRRFIGRLREELPDLVIENCSSGGHRLESSLMALTAMSSFSDAHETVDIPLIAADLSRLVWSAQKQIWAVLRADDTHARLSTSLAATFLGRMCLSGEIHGLAPDAWRFVRDAMELYLEAAPLIRDGTYRIVRNTNESWQHPTGHQYVTITSPDEAQMLVVWHRFAAPHGQDSDTVMLRPLHRDWRIRRQLHAPGDEAVLRGSSLHWPNASPWTGGVVWIVGE